MRKGHKIKEFIDIADFVERIKRYPREKIECTGHTFIRLSERQREVFTCEILRDILLGETPVRVGMQYNGNCAAFYKHERQRYIKIIVDMGILKAELVTFVISERDQLPRG